MEAPYAAALVAALNKLTATHDRMEQHLKRLVEEMEKLSQALESRNPRH